MTLLRPSVLLRHGRALRQIALGGLLATAGALLALSGRDDIRHAERMLDDALARQAGAHAALQRHSAALAEHRRIQPVLDLFARRQVIGEEQRLAWLERLDALSQSLPGQAMAWRFMPRRAIETSIVDAEAGTLEVTSSRQTLDLSLRHEGQLLDLLDALIDTVPALVRVQQCTLSRGEAAAPDTLSAHCTLDWITFRPREQR